jgi:lysozyme
MFMTETKPPRPGAAAPARVPSAAEMRALELLASDLEADEGRVPYAYADSLGFQTIGVGFLIDKRKGGKLYPEEIDFILRNRMGRALAEIVGEPWYSAVADDSVRLAAILNMQFQLGSESDEAFANSFRHIAAKDWKRAAANMRLSLWAKQTPSRAERVIAMIETGRHA